MHLALIMAKYQNVIANLGPDGAGRAAITLQAKPLIIMAYQGHLDKSDEVLSQFAEDMNKRKDILEVQEKLIHNCFHSTLNLLFSFLSQTKQINAIFPSRLANLLQSNPLNCGHNRRHQRRRTRLIPPLHHPPHHKPLLLHRW